MRTRTASGATRYVMAPTGQTLRRMASLDCMAATSSGAAAADAMARLAATAPASSRATSVP